MLERYVRRLLTAYTKSIVIKHPKCLIIGSFLVTVLLSTGVINLLSLRNNNSIDMYTPSNAESYYEKSVIDEHWPLQDNKFSVGRSYAFDRIFFVIVNRVDICPDGEPCNLLDDKKYLNMVSGIEELLATEVIVNDDDGNTYAYDLSNNKFLITDNTTKLCLNFNGVCERVASANGALNLIKSREFLKSRANVSVTYPQTNMERFRPVYLAWHLGGVFPTNGDMINVTKCIRLVFFMRSSTPLLDQMSIKLETALATYIEEVFPTTVYAKTLQARWYHSRALDIAMEENTAQLIPRFVLSFALLIAFSLVMMLKYRPNATGLSRLDMIRSKPQLAFCGIITSLSAITSAVGLLLWLQTPYNDVVAVVPFLVIAIGVDDMFIMVAAWHNTPTHHSVNERLTEAVGDAAAAITITSLTSALSFAIGMVTRLMAVRLFCAYAATAIMINYLFQLTLFAPFMLYAGRKEQAGVMALSCRQKKRSKSTMSSKKSTGTNSTSISPEKSPIGERSLKSTQSSFADHMKTAWSLEASSKAAAVGQHSFTKPVSDENSTNNSFIVKYYVPVLFHSITKCVVLIIYGGYIATAVIGCLRIKSGLQYHKLMLATNPVVEYFEYDQKYFAGGVQMEIIFNSPPSLINSTNRDRIEAIVHEFETSEWSMGASGTQFWMRSFIDYQQRTETILRDNFASWITTVASWWYDNQQAWGQDISWHPTEPKYNAFRARISLSKSYTSEDLRDAAVEFRRIANKYPEYNVTTYNTLREISDQMLYVKPNTLQTGIIAIVCMCVVAIMLIPSVTSTAIILVAMLSIDIGVLGCLSLWNVRLDPICMITLIMSIGFSVDFTAHIIYGFTTSDNTKSVRLRVTDSIVRLAWPVTQGALSTIIGVSVLTNGDSYMLTVFTKTVVLVMTLGTLHALVLLPILLDTIMPQIEVVTKRYFKKGDRS